ncbi:bifunctional phosphopantothenoylcysteine decarboxylase/phosphopantothenate--cysteine ligase CoaBC [Sulfurimonas sp.]|uniref:bifunctional phosphopantothenoylcysteine decarboxylase/phosphopantothenate--cysteine ligase CoaBC n=1 Tax=Sulfurimonas sp. TaxID=2022749 RepID=UPI0025F33704|nr:bifunctional phosphopantothenoylcysteine decarboxylase/phosphopantothenate--cysteine ligase CoaBC [Sulfurimonas sp.]MBT5935973.1 bifunctional phosphopantothenoylcysteine decarboxylase/phosphopantothenate--cysteine ligase CoaBC [Sulfurimonas sp.]
MNIPASLLQNKNILLGLTGSIAVYKSIELARLFVKSGANVKVVISESAKKFVTPLTYETITSNKVLDDTNESWTNEHNHIKITQWADIMVVAPATANTIAKLSNGISDTILLQCALAFSDKKILAPSANTNMLHNPISQENIRKLSLAKYTLVDTQTKELACKVVGDGAMAEYMDIFYTTARELLKDTFWTDREVTVTGGGTIEKIDDVRFISNFSSGKMASSMATALYLSGATVNLVATKSEPELPKGINKLDVGDSKQMLESVETSLSSAKSTQKKPYLFMAAAVSDYIPSVVQDGKLKKDSLGDEWQFSLKKNIDILKSIDKKDICVVGFKAEMDKSQALTNAKAMLKNKNLDAVCLNLLKDSSSFGSDTNAVEFITDSGVISLPESDKVTLALEIIKHAKALQE